MDVEPKGKDMKLSSKEMNAKFARWEIKEFLKDHDKDKDNQLNMLEYAEHHANDATGEHVCTPKELKEVDNDTKDVRRCSSKAKDCWERVTDAKTGEASYPAKNSKCPSKHESCGYFTYLVPKPDKDGKK